MTKTPSSNKERQPNILEKGDNCSATKKDNPASYKRGTISAHCIYLYMNWSHTNYAISSGVN